MAVRRFTDTPLGTLRWKLSIYRRNQAPASDGYRIAETETHIADVWGDVQPTGAMTFLGSVQTDAPITHRIRIRWRYGLDERCEIRRATTAPDGSTITETFRIRRANDLDGRKRFLNLEVELIQAPVS